MDNVYFWTGGILHASTLPPLGTTALAAFTATTGVNASFVPAARDAAPGRIGWIDMELAAGSHRFDLFLTPSLDARRLALHRERAPESLCITHHVGPALAEQLRAKGVRFIDTAGNAFIDDHGSFVFVAGRPAPERVKRPTSLGPSTWKVAYVLLQFANASACTVRELADHAGVSHGAAHNAVNALAERGWVHDLGRRGQRVVKWRDLWAAWELGYIDRLANKLFITHAIHPAHASLQEWVEDTAFGESALLGGELGAQRWGGEIRASTGVVHVREWDAATMRQLRLLPAANGPLVVRQMFGDCNHDPVDPSLADPMLMRAELLLIPDERLDGTRARLKRHLIERTLDNA